MSQLLALACVLLYFAAAAALVQSLDEPTLWPYPLGFLAAGAVFHVFARRVRRLERWWRSLQRARRNALRAARRRGDHPRFVPRGPVRVVLRQIGVGPSQSYREEALARIQALIHKHVPSLTVRREQLIRRSAYGIVDRGRWEAELTGFLEQVVLVEIPEKHLDAVAPFEYRWHEGVQLQDAQDSRNGSWGRRMYCQPGGTLAQLVERMVEDYAQSSVFRSAKIPEQGLSPSEYEAHCARMLRDAGWTADLVGGSGDQGADILARIGEVHVVIQCKLYSKPVGNRAVQEVFSARQFVDADFATVVTNTTFTRAAQDLAQKNGVLLLHHSELALLHERIVGPARQLAGGS